MVLDNRPKKAWTEIRRRGELFKLYDYFLCVVK